jgi:hypothetical protein
VILEILIFASQTALEAQVSQTPASAQAPVSASQDSVTLLPTLACHLAQFPNQQVHIPLDATARATLNALLTTVTLEILTFVFQTVLEIQTLRIRVNARVLLNVFRASVTLLQTPVPHHAPSLNNLDLMVLDATVLAMVNAPPETVI